MAFATLMMFQLFNVFMRAPTRGAHLKGFRESLAMGSRRIIACPSRSCDLHTVPITGVFDPRLEPQRLVVVLGGLKLVLWLRGLSKANVVCRFDSGRTCDSAGHSQGILCRRAGSAE